MKKAPVLLSIIISSLVLLLVGIIGRNNVYAEGTSNGLTEPVLKDVLMGIKDGVYPWHIFDSDVKNEAIEKVNAQKALEEEMLKKQEEALAAEEKKKEEERIAKEEAKKAKPTPTPTPTPTPEPTYTPRYEPLRETTYDEYISHISADIYGEDGVNFASEYKFKNVDISYFDDALFIGDSRTVGLRKYTDLKEHADFLCKTSMTIYKVLESDFDNKLTVEKALKNKKYGKVYIMLGINELGTGTTENFLASYTTLVDEIREISPETKIIIQAIMNIDRTQSTKDKVFNNTNILGRNNAIATLADNENIFYIDINPIVCDEDGFLRDDLRGDHLHLLGKSNELWREFLLTHGV